MATSAPPPVNTGSTNVTVSGPPTKSPTSLPPGPGSTGKLYVAPVPPGPPETAPPTVSYANDPGLGVQPDATPVVPVTEASITPPATVIGGGSGSRAVPNYIEVLANGQIIVQNATALNFSGNGVVITSNGAVATINITSSSYSYGDANVRTYLQSFGSNVLSTTGNVTAGYFVGNGSQLTGTYGNANVAANLAAFGTNPISTAGNITGGNILTGGLISATGNITGGNVLGGANVNATTHTGTTVSVSANVTGGNILTGGLISATGNITGGNLTISGNTATITTANYSIGYLNIPQISFSANATAALTDSGKHYYSTTSGNLQLTIPDNANVAFPVGTALSLVVQAAGNVLVVTQAGTTLYLGGNATAGNRVVGTYGMATIMKVATNTWFINGTGVT